MSLFSEASGHSPPHQEEWGKDRRDGVAPRRPPPPVFADGGVGCGGGGGRRQGKFAGAHNDVWDFPPRRVNALIPGNAGQNDAEKYKENGPFDTNIDYGEAAPLVESLNGILKKLYKMIYDKSEKVDEMNAEISLCGTEKAEIKQKLEQLEQQKAAETNRSEEKKKEQEAEILKLQEEMRKIKEKKEILNLNIKLLQDDLDSLLNVTAGVSSSSTATNAPGAAASSGASSSGTVSVPAEVSRINNGGVPVQVFPIETVDLSILPTQSEKYKKIEDKLKEKFESSELKNDPKKFKEWVRKVSGETNFSDGWIGPEGGFISIKDGTLKGIIKSNAKTAEAFLKIINVTVVD